MRELIGKGLLTAAAATSVLSMSGAYANAVEANGAATGSPGVLSGNNVQVPVEVPVNVCGNTADVVGVGNPAFGNGCANSSGSKAPSKPAHQQTEPAGQHAAPAPHAAHAQQAPSHAGPHDHETSSTHGSRTEHAPPSGSSATGVAQNSPGVLSGNLLQAPIDIPVNACGNSVDVVGLLNPVFGNACVNETPEAPVRPHTPVDPPVDRSSPPPHVPDDHEVMTPQKPHLEGDDTTDQLATTGSESNLRAAAALSAGLLVGGGILYRRNRAAAAHV